MRLIVHPDVDIWNFVLSGLSHRDDVSLFPLKRHCNIFQRIIRRYANEAPLPTAFIVGNQLHRAIQSLHAGDSVVIADYTDPALIIAIDKIVPKEVASYMWLWNHKGTNKSFQHTLSTIQKTWFQVVSYDESDANQFGFAWHSQFFNIRPYRQREMAHVSISFDFFFAGYAKNREEEIGKIQTLLSAFKCDFHIIHRTSEYIPYPLYMQMALQSRCIVDIVNVEDSSCTLRPLEAMAIRRKLLTNNPAVRNYSFYHPQNIFILGEDDYAQLSQFLDSPFVDLPQEIVDSYDVNAWVDIFQ